MWQPIETAPKDGTRMLIAAIIKGKPLVFVGGYDPQWASECWVSDSARIPAGFIPFFWQPLPDFPK